MRARVWPLLLALLVVIYCWLVVTQGVELLQSGESGRIALGVVVVLAPAGVIWAIAAEWRLAVRVDKMVAELAAVGDLPTLQRFAVDDAGSVGGVDDGGAGDAEDDGDTGDDRARDAGSNVDAKNLVVAREFSRIKDLVTAEPDNWRHWYHAAFVYNFAGDRRYARRALRTAARLWAAQKQ